MSVLGGCGGVGGMSAGEYPALGRGDERASP
jgi:hypothetical protein